MILYGKAVREFKLQNAEKVNATIAIILIGESQASKLYVSNKIKLAQEVGNTVNLIKLSEQVSQLQLESEIATLNSDDSVDGILVQLPLPNQLDENKIIQMINPLKDVDGFHPINIGKLFLNQEGFVPCTVLAIHDIIDFYNITLKGSNVTIVGRSNIVGKPLSLYLINKGATVTVCNSATKNIKKHIDNCDIFISAIGIAKYFTKDYFVDNNNVTIIDVGINKDENLKVVGDVDFENVAPIVKNITPVPGGVGILTVYNVVNNLILSKKMKTK